MGTSEGKFAGMESTGQVMNHDELLKTALKFGRIPAKDHHAGLHHRPGDANARHPHGEQDTCLDQQLVADQAYGQALEFEIRVVG